MSQRASLYSFMVGRAVAQGNLSIRLAQFRESFESQSRRNDDVQPIQLLETSLK
jgi:hypothetical protein